MPIQLAQTNIGRSTTSVEFTQNTIGDLDGKLFGRHRTRKLPQSYKKYDRPMLVKNKNIANCRPKNNDSCIRQNNVNFIIKS